MGIELYITEGKEQNGEIAGRVIVDRVRAFNEAKRAGANKKQFFVLGLATGSSPVTTYRHVVDAANSGEIDLGDVVTFNLDEYVGLPGATADARREHPESYWRFMDENCFGLLKRTMPAETHIPKGFNFATKDLETALSEGTEGADYIRMGREGKGKAIVIPQTCRSSRLKEVRAEMEEYEAKIASYGGIDVQVIGSGVEAHAGFHEAGIPFRINESDPSYGTEMLLVEIDHSTRRKAWLDGHFESINDAPKYALSMGNDLIFAAQQMVLLAHGEVKAKPVLNALRGHVTWDVPLSKIQQHQNAVVVVDRAAGYGLTNQPYALRQ